MSETNETKGSGMNVSAAVPIGSIRFVKELYPRVREDDDAIERYRAALDKLPPIVVARDGILVDGFHRLQAHTREKSTEIHAINLGNLSDAEIVRESITRNAAHGQQLSAKDKQKIAGKLWQSFAHLPAAERISELATMLSVSERSVQGWTKESRAAEKAEQQEKAWDLWLDCKSEREIEDEIGVPQKTLNDWLSGKRKDSESAQPPASRQHFDIWNLPPAKDDSAGAASYFGVMPPQIVENLLWLYTEPGDIIFDPFAGSGTTIDVAKRMGRRVWTSDRKPSTPNLPIHEHDISSGWPADAPAKVAFTLLDPPYWQQAAGRYSDDPDDLGNVSLDDFMAKWKAIVKTTAKHTTGKVAFIISPTQQEDGSVVDHAFEMAAAAVGVGLKIVRRIIVPYSTQQATGQQVTWARESRRLLKLYRDLVVMEKV